jgi:type II secretion system protein J
MNRPPSISLAARGFTLIEILVASLAAALIFLAVYGLFGRAIKSRDAATERIAQARSRARTAEVIRNDLQNGLISGGVLACALEGSVQSEKSHFPGYLRLTTTTGKNRSGETYGDVQQVEYYLVEDNSDQTGGKSGTLMRVLTRDLLASVQEISREETLLSHVESFEVAFYDGSDWQDSWLVSGTATTLPQAIRVHIKQTAASERLPTPPPLEIMTPWTTQPLTSSTTGTST